MQTRATTTQCPKLSSNILKGNAYALLVAEARGRAGTYMDKEPIQPILPKRFAVCKFQEAAAGIIAEMLQVGVHGICATPEVNGVGVPETVLLHIILRHLQQEGWIKLLQHSVSCCLPSSQPY